MRMFYGNVELGKNQISQKNRKKRSINPISSGTWYRFRCFVWNLVDVIQMGFLGNDVNLQTH